MITENLSTLKIHKLTQEQYERELTAGRIDPSALYLTPDNNDTNIYVQNEEPANVKDGTLWVDLDAESMSNSGSSNGGNNTNVDLSNYALKSDIPTKVSQLINDSNYITATEAISYINSSILGGAW